MRANQTRTRADSIEFLAVVLPNTNRSGDDTTAGIAGSGKDPIMQSFFGQSFFGQSFFGQSRFGQSHFKQAYFRRSYFRRAHFMRANFAARAALASIAMIGTFTATTLAEVPTAPPIFSNPLEITNQYAPFVVNSVKTYRGKSDGERTVVVDLFTDETRTFMIGSTPVDTRLLQETEFEDGKTVEISYNYFAQADDGTLYYFGEVVDCYEDGIIVDHGGSWLVGGPMVGDPVSTATATDPALFMPANPEVGDVFKPEDLFPFVDETVTVKKNVKKLKVEAGKFKNVIKVKETNAFDSDFEFKWYALGIGVISTSAEDEHLDLIASTLIQDGE